MKATVNIAARINEGDKFPFRKVKFEVRRNKPVALGYLVPGSQEIHPLPADVTFYILPSSKSGSRSPINVGKDFDVAWIRYQNEEANLERNLRGLQPIQSTTPTETSSQTSQTVAAAIADYRSTLEQRKVDWDRGESGGLAPGSVEKYDATLSRFEQYCNQTGVRFTDELRNASTGPRVLLGFKDWLYEQLPQRLNGHRQYTLASNFRNLNAFYTALDIVLSKKKNARPSDPGLLEWRQVPHAPKKGRGDIPNPDMYSSEELRAMLDTATTDEADLIHFFLGTGFRKGEATFAVWADVDWRKGEITVQDKPEYGWRVKDKTPRTIPLNDKLLARLRARKERQGSNPLIFPNSLGRPDKGQIRILRRVVAKARTAGHEIKAPIELHKFRRNYATLLSQAGCGIATIQQYLGHSDLETTRFYLAPDESAGRQATNRAFAGIGKD